MEQQTMSNVCKAEKNSIYSLAGTVILANLIYLSGCNSDIVASFLLEELTWVCLVLGTVGFQS